MSRLHARQQQQHQHQQHQQPRATNSLAVSRRRGPQPVAAMTADQVPAPPEVPAPQLPFRVGHGFDLHRLEEGCEPA